MGSGVEIFRYYVPVDIHVDWEAKPKDAFPARLPARLSGNLGNDELHDKFSIPENLITRAVTDNDVEAFIQRVRESRDEILYKNMISQHRLTILITDIGQGATQAFMRYFNVEMTAFQGKTVSVTSFMGIDRVIVENWRSGDPMRFLIFEEVPESAIRL
jgi:hypothetical protein